MPNFTGQLRPNEVFAALFNMLISQQVFADNIDGLDDSLVSKARVDGSMYGDTKLYYSTDSLHSHTWGQDAEATNLLALHRPKGPKCQAISLDVFRQVDLTIDNYLTKRAWSTEYAFSSFNSVMLSWLGSTKKIYDTLTYNAFIGTNVSAKPAQNIEVEIPEETDEASRRVRAQKIAQAVSILTINLKDVTRDYNDYGHLRSYPKAKIKFVWNANYVTEITKLDLPSIYHENKVFGDGAFDESLPARFFGTVNKVGGTVPGSNKKIRSLIEKNFLDDGNEEHIVYPGELLQDGATYEANETYTQDDNVLCKVLVKLPPFMSAFEVGTSFFNAKSLTENHYFTWGHNTLEHLQNYPYITIKAKTLKKAA